MGSVNNDSISSGRAEDILRSTRGAFKVGPLNSRPHSQRVCLGPRSLYFLKLPPNSDVQLALRATAPDEGDNENKEDSICQEMRRCWGEGQPDPTWKEAGGHADPQMAGSEASSPLAFKWKPLKVLSRGTVRAKNAGKREGLAIEHSLWAVGQGRTAQP